MEVIKLGNIYGYDGGNYAGNVYDKNAVDNTLTNMQECRQQMIIERGIAAIDEQNMTVRNETFGTIMTDGSSPKHNNRVLEIVAIKQATKDGYIECKVGRWDVCPTLTAQGESITKSSTVLKCDNQYCIRKLTPKECWRLMAFSDKDFHKAEAVSSNTQLYKQAGNSIVVSVL